MKRTGRVLVVFGIAAGMLLVGGIGFFLRPGSSAAPASARPAGPLPPPPPAVVGGSLSQAIAGLQARLRALPRDWQDYATLGQAYVQQARVTADPTYYPKAQGVLERSLQINAGQNAPAMTGMAALAAARHDFAGALRWGERAQTIDPDSANVYAVIGDAQIELGRYDDAFQTFQTMIDLKPSLSTYSRVSYGWELQGNLPNAIRAMNLALDAAGNPADAAWASNQLGELYWNSGQAAKAARFYRRAVEEDRTYLPARVGLAKVAFAGGHLDAAIDGYRGVVARYPLPEYVIALGDLDTVAGRTEDAARQYALVHAEERLFQASGVNVDLEIGLFDADHHVDLARGLAAAQAEWGRRHGVLVADALGWELYANGRAGEALAYANQALRLGTRNALFFFHRGMIERALGRTDAARHDLAEALRINPHFSVLWAAPAARILHQLGGAA